MLPLMIAAAAASTPGAGWEQVGRAGVAAAPVGAALVLVGGAVSLASASDGGGGDGAEERLSRGRARGAAIMGVGGAAVALSAPVAALGRQRHGRSLGVDDSAGRLALTLSAGGLALAGAGLAAGNLSSAVPNLSVGLVTLGGAAWLASWPAIYGQRVENQRGVSLSPVLGLEWQGVSVSVRR